MNHQLDANTRKARKARKGTINSVIRAGRIGVAAAALVWALLVAIFLIVARFFIFVGSHNSAGDEHCPTNCDYQGRTIDRPIGHPYRDPDD